jgi:hypothetical protein
MPRQIDLQVTLLQVMALRMMPCTSEPEQEFGKIRKIRAVLPSYAGNERAFHRITHLASPYLMRSY